MERAEQGERPPLLAETRKEIQTERHEVIPPGGQIDAIQEPSAEAPPLGEEPGDSAEVDTEVRPGEEPAVPQEPSEPPGQQTPPPVPLGDVTAPAPAEPTPTVLPPSKLTDEEKAELESDLAEELGETEEAEETAVDEDLVTVPETEPPVAGEPVPTPDQTAGIPPLPQEPTGLFQKKDTPEEREVEFKRSVAEKDKYQQALKDWEAALPANQPLVFEKTGSGFVAITRDPQGGWRATTFNQPYRDSPRLAPWGHERYATRYDAVKQHARTGKLSSLPDDIMTEQDIKDHRLGRLTPEEAIAEGVAKEDYQRAIEQALNEGRIDQAAFDANTTAADSATWPEKKQPATVATAQADVRPEEIGTPEPITTTTLPAENTPQAPVAQQEISTADEPTPRTERISILPGRRTPRTVARTIGAADMAGDVQKATAGKSGNVKLKAQKDLLLSGVDKALAEAPAEAPAERNGP